MGAHQALQRALPAVSRGAATDLLLLKEGAREVIRMSCDSAAADGIVAGCIGLGLAATRWHGSVMPVSYAAGTTFVLASVPSRPGEAGRRTFVFAGRSADTVAAAARLVDDDEATGEILGYPGCCVCAYRANIEHHLSALEPSFAREQAGPWPFWCNSPMDVLGWHLLSHFPCAPSCAASREAALTHFRALARADAPFAMATLLRLRTIVFIGASGLAYGHEENGAFAPAGFSDSWNPASARRYDFTGNA
jgi:hypothetical protein